MAGYVTKLATNIEDPTLIHSLVELVTIENAYAATAHAPNHVTREQGVKNNYIFGIP